MLLRSMLPDVYYATQIRVWAKYTLETFAVDLMDNRRLQANSSKFVGVNTERDIAAYTGKYAIS